MPQDSNLWLTLFSGAFGVMFLFIAFRLYKGKQKLLEAGPMMEKIKYMKPMEARVFRCQMFFGTFSALFLAITLIAITIVNVSKWF